MKVKQSSSMYNSTAQAILYRKSKNWTSLMLMLDNDDRIVNAPRAHPWASKPTTAKALAICFLAHGAEKDSGVLATYVKGMTKDLMRFLESQSSDLQDHSLLFLINTVECLADDIKRDLTSLGIFQVLLLLFKDDTFDRRHAAAYLCSRLYVNSKPRQQAFLDLEGHFAMVELIARDMLDKQVKAAELLMYLKELIVTGDDSTYETDLISRLKETQVLDLLKTAEQEETDLNTSELVEELTSQLQNSL
jgi:hypothetical protein